MCHLTATKQTQFVNCDQQDFVSQLETVFAHCDQDHNWLPANYMHINWMARGEPLSNPTITETSTELLLRLGSMARDRGLGVKFNISTIMPKTLRKPLVECFPIITPTIYYSIYSVNEAWRQHWLPGAMRVSDALSDLQSYQQLTKKLIKFHCAFIKDENDSEKDVRAMMNAIRTHNIRGEFNIVRYNPFSSEQKSESPYIDSIADIIGEYMPCKVIPRVGIDCKASCGTFIQGSEQ
jgi:adenine C2-methylase RlmN of 23S rRNA A2503 and tRNA A37